MCHPKYANVNAAWLCGAFTIGFVGLVVCTPMIVIWAPSLEQWVDTKCHVVESPKIWSTSTSCACDCVCLLNIKPPENCIVPGEDHGTQPVKRCSISAPFACFACDSGYVSFCATCHFQTWYAQIKVIWYDKIREKWKENTITYQQYDSKSNLDSWLKNHVTQFDCTYPRYVDVDQIIDDSYEFWYNRAVWSNVAVLLLIPLIIIIWIMHISCIYCKSRKSYIALN